MSGPSEKASEAAWFASTLEESTTGEIRAVLAAAHDPALGLDRSVCLRDVVEWLRENSRPAVIGLFPERLPELAEREFGGGA